MIPAYNEANTIGKVIEGIPRDIAGVRELEVLVVDDGSEDKTVEVAKEAGADHIVSHLKNRGVGMSFRSGMDKALELGADIIVNMDGDGQFDPQDIKKLVAPIVNGEADFVTGTRFAKKEFEPDMPFIKKFGNKLFTQVINLLSDHDFTDTQCGFRSFNRDTALRLTLFGRYTYTHEVFIELACKRSVRIIEIPIKVKLRRSGKSRVVTNVFSYGFKAMVIITRSIRDYKPLRFFGTIGLLIFSMGGLGLFTMGLRWLLTNLITPYRTIIDLSLLAVILGFLLIFLALIADMLDRQRQLEEEILFRLKKDLMPYKK